MKRPYWGFSCCLYNNHHGDIEEGEEEDRDQEEDNEGDLMDWVPLKHKVYEINLVSIAWVPLVCPAWHKRQTLVLGVRWDRGRGWSWSWIKSENLIFSVKPTWWRGGGGCWQAWQWPNRERRRWRLFWGRREERRRGADRWPGSAPGRRRRWSGRWRRRPPPRGTNANDKTPRQRCRGTGARRWTARWEGL